jgi:Matrixin
MSDRLALKEPSVDDIVALGILAKLGYLPSGEMSHRELTRFGVSQFQIYYDLTDKSGDLSEETKRALRRPRCSFPDKINIFMGRDVRTRVRLSEGRFVGYRLERFDVDVGNVEPVPWPTRAARPFTLFFALGGGVVGKRKDAVLSAMVRWSKVRDSRSDQIVQFQPAANNITHFLIDWVGDSASPVMEANDVADACLPNTCPLPMPLRFNGAKAWIADAEPDPGSFLIETVAAHEIGHVLGLVHPVKRNSTLMDLELGEGKLPDLQPGDEQALRDLYDR